MTKEENGAIGRKLLAVLEESFGGARGYYLDKGSSFLETLAGIEPATASREFPAARETIAGHVHHVILALRYSRDYLQGKDLSGYDWSREWRAGVDAASWEALVARLAGEYATTRAFLEGVEDWLEGSRLDLIVGSIAHCAYHLAIIRQHLEG